MLKKLWIILLFLVYVEAGEIRIAVSANVSYAIDALSKAFAKKHPNIKVKIILGGSGKLTAQIKHGAPYDLFMSANMAYPNALYQEGLALGKPKIYAQGSLAILSVKGMNFGKGLSFLGENNIDKIALANPKTAPYGTATIEALKNAKLYKKVKDKLIYAESIAQTVSYILRATDIGFVAKSSLFSPKMAKFKEYKHWVSLDRKLYTPINQGILMLKNTKNQAQVQAFYDFILSVEAQKILKNFGYTFP